MEGGHSKNGSQSCDPRHEGPGVFAYGGPSSHAIPGSKGAGLRRSPQRAGWQ